MTQLADLRSPVSTELTADDLARYRDLVTAELAESERLVMQLSADMASFLASRRDIPTDDEHDPEGPTLAFERDQANAILMQTRARAREMEDALRRIERGTYGICSRCRKPIARGRLDVRPYALRCVTCAD